MVPSLRSHYAFERMIFKLFIHKEQDALNSSFAPKYCFHCPSLECFPASFCHHLSILVISTHRNTFSFEFTSFRLTREALGETKANWLLFFHVW